VTGWPFLDRRRAFEEIGDIGGSASRFSPVLLGKQ